ncbi:hypothetical protein BAU08_19580 [Bordetella bronchialis]|uniref:Uncharacterized protein n=1 Tax=Bordetella bronchialis TaxID=463025 RepID=A0A193FZS0_9BORD|nr:hypothetical protein BAU08_19580 [Bordetella bronchialis]
MFIKSSVPEFVCTTFGPFRLFPEKIRSFSNRLLQPLLRFRIGRDLVALGCQLTAAADMYTGAQAFQFSVWNQMTACSGLQRFRHVSRVVGSLPMRREGDAIGV